MKSSLFFVPFSVFMPRCKSSLIRRCLPLSVDTDTPMTATCFSDTVAFLAEVQAFLEADEARFNLVLAILDSLRRGEQKHQPFLGLVKNNMGELDTVAIRTPPWQLLLATGSEEGLGAIADSLLAEHADLPGVHGLEYESKTFARLWSERTGLMAVNNKQLRSYMVAEVEAPNNVDGKMRQADLNDAPLITEWSEGFHRDAGTDDPEKERRDRTVFMLEQGRLVLWEVEGKPVTMAGWHPSPPRAARIGYVYTPPELRRHGYATALTAGLSQHLLDSGLACCFLFTDLANPTSNGIYQKIGYKPVGDYWEYRFEKP